MVGDSGDKTLVYHTWCSLS